MAAADRPVISQETMSLTSELTGVCGFPITVDYTMTEIDRFFSDSSGVLTRASATGDEQDRFSANGKFEAFGQPMSFPPSHRPNEDEVNAKEAQ
jgi:hypothetical protein